LRAMTQEELQEQINPWISLQMAYESLIEDYVFPEGRISNLQNK